MKKKEIKDFLIGSFNKLKLINFYITKNINI